MWSLTLLALSLTAGCSEPLFTDNAPRSQYERYAALRGRSAPQVETDSNGREKPALRERLRPLDTP